MNLPPDLGRRLLEAYDACLALDAEARERHLAALAADDPGFATRLRTMLAYAVAQGEQAELGVSSVLDALGRAERGRDDDAAAAPMPRAVGPFAVRRLLGRGGMGEVWLAEREHEGFRQQVALKRLRSGRDGDDLRRRFVQERRILAELSHPGIARFIDGGVDEDGAPWYAMEYVQGVPITEHARAQALDVRARVALLADVAEAVAYAQNRLVVHRDLKPSNILIDAEGRPRLLDFGIAKLLEDGAGDAGETGAGLRAMTPDYAAPEQILGAPISTATDVYALGVVLYQLLTGELPHARGAASLESLVDAVRSEAPERPSARLRRAGAGGTTSPTTARALRGDLDLIVLTALRREPERRYAAAADLARDLRRWLAGQPVAAQADTARYRLRKFVGRHRLAVGAASGVLLALIAGFGTALWQAAVAHRESGRAEAQARIAQAEAAKATAIKDFLLASFNTAQIGRRAGEDSPMTVLELIERGGDSLLVDDKLGVEARLELLTALGELQRINGLVAKADTLQSRALELSRDLYGETSPKYVYALVERATTLPELGRRDESNRLYDEAIALMERTGQQVSESYPYALWMRGVNAYSADQHDEALGFFERAEVACRDFRPTDPTYSAALQWQANVHLLRDGFDAAETALRKAVTLAREGKLPEQAEGMTRLYLGDLATRKGEFDEALAEYERSAQLLRQIEAGDRNPDRAVLLATTARARYESGQREAALADLRAALDIARHHPIAEPARSLTTRARSVELMIRLGEADAATAVPLAREISALWPPGSSSAFFANNQMLLSEAELLGGDAKAARAAAERAVGIHEAADTDTLLARQARLLLAEAMEGLDAAAARDSYRRVLVDSRADRAAPPARARSLQRARALAGLARLARADDPAASARFAREGLALLPEPRFTRERRVHAALQGLAATR